MSGTDSVGTALCAIARASIEQGVRTGLPSPPPRPVDPALAVHRACFVTLHIGEALRGCIGSLQACRPLADDVHMNAFAAGFRDPRFTPLTPAECARLRVSISVLGDLTPVPFADESSLLATLVAGEDGLLIRSGDRQATFLPSVWRQIADPVGFLQALKRKARLAPDCVDYEALRYRCEHYRSA